MSFVLYVLPVCQLFSKFWLQESFITLSRDDGELKHPALVSLARVRAEQQGGGSGCARAPSACTNPGWCFSSLPQPPLTCVVPHPSEENNRRVPFRHAGGARHRGEGDAGGASLERQVQACGDTSLKPMASMSPRLHEPGSAAALKPQCRHSGCIESQCSSPPTAASTHLLSPLCREPLSITAEPQATVGTAAAPPAPLAHWRSPGRVSAVPAEGTHYSSLASPSQAPPRKHLPS